jgi:hypothetical protein
MHTFQEVKPDRIVKVKNHKISHRKPIYYEARNVVLVAFYENDKPDSSHFFRLGFPPKNPYINSKEVSPGKIKAGWSDFSDQLSFAFSTVYFLLDDH